MATPIVQKRTRPEINHKSVEKPSKVLRGDLMRSSARLFSDFDSLDGISADHSTLCGFSPFPVPKIRDPLLMKNPWPNRAELVTCA
jgi:hypothetical protein